MKVPYRRTIKIRIILSLIALGLFTIRELFIDHWISEILNMVLFFMIFMPDASYFTKDVE